MALWFSVKWCGSFTGWIISEGTVSKLLEYFRDKSSNVQFFLIGKKFKTIDKWMHGLSYKTEAQTGPQHMCSFPQFTSLNQILYPLIFLGLWAKDKVEALFLINEIWCWFWINLKYLVIALFSVFVHGWLSLSSSLRLSLSLTEKGIGGSLAPWQLERAVISPATMWLHPTPSKQKSTLSTLCSPHAVYPAVYLHLKLVFSSEPACSCALHAF